VETGPEPHEITGAAIAHKGAVNPVPRTYACVRADRSVALGLPVRCTQTGARGVLSFDLETLDRWYGVNTSRFDLTWVK
jgi:hypothetical protein